MQEDKLINFRIPNDLKIAFDSVCKESRQTRTHQLISLMRDHVDQETRKLDQQNQSIRHLISRSKNQHQDHTRPRYNLSDDLWTPMEEDEGLAPSYPPEFFYWKGF
jgi:hypothetical protein